MPLQVQKTVRRGLSPRPESHIVGILDKLENEFCTGSNAVKELISVSFIEHLPRSPNPGFEIRTMLGPCMRREMDEIG